MARRTHPAIVAMSSLSLGACATGSKSTSASQRQEPVASAGSACGGSARIGVGTSEHTLDSGGIRRRLLVHVPAAHASDAALPLVFTLHGSGGTPEGQLAESGLAALADAEGFLLALPEGVGNRWNVPPEADKPDDVRFISDALDAVDTLVCVDRQRVFATGFSGGARMSSQLACDLSTRIAAVAAIGGVRFPGPCSEARAFPMLAFHGTADDVNPYAGGGQPYWQTGVEPAIDGWARHNACAARTEEVVAAGVARISYSDCIDVVLYRIDGFGHRWPQAVTPEGGANELLWSFFERHALPATP